jgi:hypothetical protein
MGWLSLRLIQDHHIDGLAITLTHTRSHLLIICMTGGQTERHLRLIDLAHVMMDQAGLAFAGDGEGVSTVYVAARSSKQIHMGLFPC